MFASAFFNLASLILGVLAWVIPITAVILKRTGGCACSIASYSACAAALVFQIFEIRNRAHLGDWSAILDTVGTLSWVAVVLVVVTAFLNLVAYHRIKGRQD